MYSASYNDVNATRAVIGLCPWSIRAQIHSLRWHHAKLVLFVLFNMGARFWKWLWDYLGLKQVKASKKDEQELFTKKKNGETGTKGALEYFKIPKTTRNLHNSCHRVSSLRGTRCFSKYFRHCSALSKKRSWKLNFSKKLYTSKIKRKRRSRDEK